MKILSIFFLTENKTITIVLCFGLCLCNIAKATFLLKVEISSLCVYLEGADIRETWRKKEKGVAQNRKTALPYLTEFPIHKSIFL